MTTTKNVKKAVSTDVATTNDEWSDAAEVQSNWFKFESVGDRIRGTLLSKRLQKSTDGAFPDQWVYELRTMDGTTYSVGISVNKQGTVQRLNNCKLGEIIGIWFEKEGEAGKKGFHPAKFLKVLTWGMDPNYNEFDAGKEVEGPGINPALPNFDADGE